MGNDILIMNSACKSWWKAALTLNFAGGGGSFKIVGMCQLMKMTVNDSQVTVIKTDMNTCEVTQLYFWNCCNMYQL